ncbi:MAG: hypothetical protein PVH85_13850 [Desulfobacterales bacterium]
MEAAAHQELLELFTRLCRPYRQTPPVCEVRGGRPEFLHDHTAGGSLRPSSRWGHYRLKHHLTAVRCPGSS